MMAKHEMVEHFCVDGSTKRVVYKLRGRVPLCQDRKGECVFSVSTRALIALTSYNEGLRVLFFYS